MVAEAKDPFVLSGHTDNVGDAKMNKQLSEDRVAKVKDHLFGRGISGERITTIGYGGTKPKIANTSEINKAKNRRVEVTVLKW